MRNLQGFVDGVTAFTTTYDYRLIFFLLPLAVLPRSPVLPRHAGDVGVLVLVLVLVLVPKWLPVLYEEVTADVVLNALLIASLLLVGAGIREELAQRSGEAHTGAVVATPARSDR